MQRGVLKKINSRGLTLIEIIIAIAIVSILATVMALNIGGTLIRSRDAQRKNDLKKIQIALQLYYQDHGVYPSTYNSISGYWQDYSTGSQPWIPELISQYIEKLPVDPVSGSVYMYVGYVYPNPSSQNGCKAGETYTLFTTLENAQDPDLIQNANSQDCTGALFKDNGISGNAYFLTSPK